VEPFPGIACVEDEPVYWPELDFERPGLNSHAYFERKLIYIEAYCALRWPVEPDL